MSNKPSGHPVAPASPTATLCGSDAFKVLDELNTKLRQASAMATVLNVAAFAESVTLPPAEFQDFTTRLAAELGELCELVADLTLSQAAPR